MSLFQNTQAVEWEGAVASHRLQLTSEFFDHVENLIHASHQDKQQREGKQSASGSHAHSRHAVLCLATVSLMIFLHELSRTTDMVDMFAT